jgi:hypothetical protein
VTWWSSVPEERATGSIEETHEAVLAILAQNAELEMHDEGGIISVPRGSTEVFVLIEEILDGHSWIVLTSPLLRDVSPSAAMFEYVALQADRFRWGHLSARRHEDGTVSLWLTYGLLGTYLHEDELKLALETLARAADEVDDVLQRRFGGTRFRET